MRYLLSVLSFIFFFVVAPVHAAGDLTPTLTPTLAPPVTYTQTTGSAGLITPTPILADTLTSNGTISAILRLEDNVYIGGNFTSVRVGTSAAQMRMNLASFQPASLQLTTWNPSPNATVEALLADQSTIYVGGHFTTISGQLRNRLASFNRNDGALTNWQPNVNNTVYSLAQDESKLYVGGAFTEINGQPRYRVAIFEKSSGNLTTWGPNVNDTVYAVAADDRFIIIGGAFTQVDGQPRQHLAAFDKNNGALLPWNPSIKEVVRGIVIVDDIVYVTGEISPRTNNTPIFTASINKITGQVISYTLAPTIIPIPTDGGGLMIDEDKLGFKVPTLGDLLTFAIRGFFVVAGLLAFFYMMLGALAWVTSGGEKEAVGKARNKIQSAVVGMIVIVVVLSIIWTLENVVFRRRICIGLSCSLTIPSLLNPI